MGFLRTGQQVCFGLVGCGQVVQDLHLPAWSAVSEAKLVAICDSSQTSLDAVSQRVPSAHRYKSIDDLLGENRDLSFVVLATPGASHPGLARKILAKGINLLCEKPLALSSAEARSMCSLADETGATFTGIHNYRFKENTRQALRAVRKGELGDIVGVNLKFRSGPLFGEKVRWRRHERENRTLLFESAIHLVDIATLFLGPLKSLQFVDADLDRLGIQRVVFGTLHENGSRGAFDLMVDASSTSTEIEVLGESAGLALQFFPQGFRKLPARDTPLHRGLAEGQRLLDYARDTIAERLLRPKCPPRARSHADLFRAFIGALREQEPNPVPASDLLPLIQLLDEVAIRAYGTESSAAPSESLALETAASAK